MFAILQPELIHRIVESFPFSGEWQRLRCADLRAPTTGKPDARNWSPLTATGSKGGVYAFLFPKCHFDQPRKIVLDGPGQSKIPFKFTAIANLLTTDEQVVVYVGRAANLLQRFQWHFSLAERNTGAQVQNGLVKCRLCPRRKQAVSFMLDHATIAFRILNGIEHAANRDIIEISLCAKFMSPFNIKSER